MLSSSWELGLVVEEASRTFVVSDITTGVRCGTFETCRRLESPARPRPRKAWYCKRGSCTHYGAHDPASDAEMQLWDCDSDCDCDCSLRDDS